MKFATLVTPSSIYMSRTPFSNVPQHAQWSQRKWNITCTMVMYGETFYCGHTALTGWARLTRLNSSTISAMIVRICSACIAGSTLVVTWIGHAARGAYTNLPPHNGSITISMSIVSTCTYIVNTYITHNKISINSVFVVCFIQALCHFQQSFRHIATVSRCGRELNTHF